MLTLGRPYDYDDLLIIAKGQLEQEDRMVASLKTPVVFIDTDMYVMKVWCEFVFGKCHPFILDEIVKRKYDAYLLCNTDLPWVADELREYPDPDSRKRLYRMYKDLVVNQSTPWFEISGGYEERLGKAIVMSIVNCQWLILNASCIIIRSWISSSSLLKPDATALGRHWFRNSYTLLHNRDK